MDPLSLLLDQFSMHAGVFYTGRICGVHDFEADRLRGHIHLIRQGPVELIDDRGNVTSIVQPTLLFLPRPEKHRLIADDERGAQVMCATVQIGGGCHNPICDSLPSAVQVELAALPGIDGLLTLMADEAFGAQPGRQATLNRLCELLMIRVLRHCMDQGLTQAGMLAGMSDPRLAKVLLAIHDEPGRAWELSDMAAAAGMSRARFAARFHEITGQTPLDYLAAWRIAIAQHLLRSGRQMKHVALDVGYGSASAFTRAFIRRIGLPPSRWLKELERKEEHPAGR